MGDIIGTAVANVRLEFYSHLGEILTMPDCTVHIRWGTVTNVCTLEPVIHFCSSRRPGTVEWCAKCKINRGFSCGTTFCTASSMANTLTKSPFLSKLHDDPGVPTTGRILLQKSLVLYTIGSALSTKRFSSFL